LERLNELWPDGREPTPFARFVAASRPGPWRGASLQASPGRYAYGRFKEGNLPDVSRVSRRPLVAELASQLGLPFPSIESSAHPAPSAA